MAGTSVVTVEDASSAEAAAAAAAAETWTLEVLQHEPKVAVFDCDGTLWSPDSGFGFMRWSLGNGLVPARAAEWLNRRYEQYLAGSVDEATICGEMVQAYAGLREQELREAAARFVEEQVAPHIFPALEALVAELRRRGVELWAVSSTSDWVVEAGVVERFGIPPERVLAAKVRVVDGLATAELLAVPTDEAKAEALASRRLTRPDAVFGNSMHDLAMLELARRPYPVNPSKELLARARALGWPVFFPAGSETEPPAYDEHGG